MDHETRRAEIVWLRSRVAAGSEDITRIHLPLIGHLIKEDETAEAVALSIVAADQFWARGFQLKAFAVLNRALALEPGNPELTRRHAAWSAIVHPDLLAVVHPSRRRGVVPFRPLLDEQHLGRITRCTVRVVGACTSLQVEIEHVGAIPTNWLRNARYALAIVGHDEPIPCTARVEVAQAYWHRLELTPSDTTAAAKLDELVCANPVTGRSNIEALVITTGNALPRHVRNIDYAEPLGIVAEA